MTVRPKKKLGQHFLTTESVAQRIINSINYSNGNILEIGPGTGVLTKYLLNIPNINLYVVELDEESVEYLYSRYPAISQRIIAKDFLAIDIKNIFDSTFSIVGNFPYNISSQILFKLLENKNIITSLTGMFQKEVAERIAAKPGNKNYGILSVLIQAFFDVEYLFTVDETNFYPRPKVKSAVIRITKNINKNLNCDELLFKNIVKTSFNQRRKILRNSLKIFTFNMDLLDESIFFLRPEQLTVTQFETLCNSVINT